MEFTEAKRALNDIIFEMGQKIGPSFDPANVSGEYVCDWQNKIAEVRDALSLAPAALLAEVADQLRKAEYKHAPMHGEHEGWAVIFEELDELWDEVKRQPVDPIALRKEALHVAAMGLRFVKDVCQ